MCPLGCPFLVCGQYGYRCQRFGVDLTGNVPMRCQRCGEDGEK